MGMHSDHIPTKIPVLIRDWFLQGFKSSVPQGSVLSLFLFRQRCILCSNQYKESVALQPTLHLSNTHSCSILKIPRSPQQHRFHFSKGSTLECHRERQSHPHPWGMEQNLYVPHSAPNRRIWVTFTISAAPFTNTKCVSSQHVKYAQRFPYSLLVPKSQRAKMVPLGKQWIFSFWREYLRSQNAILICCHSLLLWISPDFPGKEYKASKFCSPDCLGSGKEQLRRKMFYISMIKR